MLAACTVVRYAGLKTALRCYHEMAMPVGLLVVGDSVMELDPLLAQVSPGLFGPQTIGGWGAEL